VWAPEQDNRSGPDAPPSVVRYPAAASAARTIGAYISRITAVIRSPAPFGDPA